MVSASRAPADVWRRKTTKVALSTQFLKSVSGSKAIGRDGMSPAAFEIELKRNIININHSLRAGKHTFSAYQEILKSKGFGKNPRQISLPIVRDRVVLRAMAEILNEIEPSCSVELAQGKIARVIEALSDKRYTHFVKLDVVNFYPTISHSWLQAALTKAVRRPSIVAKFMAAVATPTVSPGRSKPDLPNARGVPQGLAISNGLAELAMQHVDHAIRSNPGVAYFRYVDDILVLMAGDYSSQISAQISDGLALAGLTAHPVGQDDSKSSKGRICDGFEFLGYAFSWPRVSVRAPSVRRLESSIARSFTRYKYALRGPQRAGDWPARCVEKLQWHLDLIVSGCVFEGNRLGWLAYFSQIRHHQLLEHLDSLVSKQAVRHGIVGFTPKAFVASYRFAASKKIDSTGFVPNFDAYLPEEMRHILSWIFFVDARLITRMDDNEVRVRFNKKIRGLVVELEKDIQATY